MKGYFKILSKFTLMKDYSDSGGLVQSIIRFNACRIRLQMEILKCNKSINKGSGPGAVLYVAAFTKKSNAELHENLNSMNVVYMLMF